MHRPHASRAQLGKKTIGTELRGLHDPSFPVCPDSTEMGGGTERALETAAGRRGMWGPSSRRRRGTRSERTRKVARLACAAGPLS